ncbi:MAG: LysM peptidoglycan-binding domain-containing protein [Candidatus Riflebacteria bacterium]|nr:LysM peptidoglycan-binding domain-containing protein [Candidatus Riflebacteria bacterium]
MRHVFPKLALFASLALGGATLAAEPILGGHYLPTVHGAKDDKPIFLAHLFNPDAAPIGSGNLQIGLELNGKKGCRVFILKPTEEVPAGGIRTFRFPVSLKNDERDGTFRLFSRIQSPGMPIGKTIYSDSYSFDNLRPDAKTAATLSLYSEAPPESETPSPPPEIPFEGEVQQQRGHIPSGAGVSATTAKPVMPDKSARVKTNTPAASPKTRLSSVAISRIPAAVDAPAPASSISATSHGKDVKKDSSAFSEALESKSQKESSTALNTHPIDASEFKSLRTIDEELVIYVVKNGDTLKSVAEKYYSDAGRDKAIADLNFIERTGKLKTGEEIIVEVRPLKDSQGASSVKEAKHDEKEADDHGASGKKEKPPKNVSKKVSETPATVSESSGTSAESRTYTIKSGDTLAIIAKKFLGKASQAGRLIKANPNLNPKNMKVGTTIVVPPGTGNNA